MKGTKRLYTLVTLVTLLSLGFATDAQAQKFRRSLLHYDSLLSERYRRSNIDTMYITRPKTRWTLKGRINVSGAALKIEGMDQGAPYKSEMRAAYKSTLSLGVNYLGVSLGLSLNPAKLMGKYKDFELNVNLYNNPWGFDFIYQDARNFTGWYETEGKPRTDTPPEVLTLKSLNVNAYYAFNHRRFSYPAAFTQSYIQRRSAGSFLLAASAQAQQAETNASIKSLLNVTNIGIGAGYGYNWVPASTWLFHLSALPTFIIYSNTSLKVNDNRIPLDYHFPEVIITARGAIVRQFGRMFVGTTMVFNYTNIGNRNDLEIQNNKWRVRFIVGFRL